MNLTLEFNSHFDRVTGEIHDEAVWKRRKQNPMPRHTDSWQALPSIIGQSKKGHGDLFSKAALNAI
jgi:hypothetical protein